jgi:hypothetical protein
MQSCTYLFRRPAKFPRQEVQVVSKVKLRSYAPDRGFAKNNAVAAKCIEIASARQEG